MHWPSAMPFPPELGPSSGFTGKQPFAAARAFAPSSPAPPPTTPQIFPVIALPTAMFAAMPAPAAKIWQVAELAMSSYETPLIAPPRFMAVKGHQLADDILPWLSSQGIGGSSTIPKRNRRKEVMNRVREG